MIERDGFPPMTLQRRVATWLRLVAEAMDPQQATRGAQGSRLRFERTGAILGHPAYIVRSVRGGFIMGRVEWSNQWRLPKFTPAADAVFDRTCLAELYALMREIPR